MTKKLSNREVQIVRLIQKAKTNKEISGLTGLTYESVKEYVHRIFQKTGVTNRTELALWGLKNPDIGVPSSL